MAKILSGFEAPLQLAYSPAGNSQMHNFGHLQVPKSTLNFTHPRICPECIIENGFIPRLWDLKTYIACHVHNRMMIDICPNCSVKLSWGRPCLLSCGCGHNFRHTDVEAPDHILRYVRLLAERSEESPRRSRSRLPNLGACALLTWFFACEPMSDHYRSNAKSNPSVEKVSDLISPVVEMAPEWPNSFFEWLASHRLDALGTSISADFGPFPNRLTRLFKACGYEYIIDEFAEYLRDQWSGIRVQPFSPLYRERLDQVPCGEAAKLLNLPVKEIVHLVEKGIIKGNVIRNKNKIRGWVSISSIKKFITDIGSSITYEQAGQQLGIDRHQVSKLVNAGHISKTINLRKNRQLYTSNINKFVKKLFDISEYIPATTGMGCISIKDLAASPGYNFFHNITAVLENRIPIYRTVPKNGGLRELFIPLSHIEQSVDGKWRSETGQGDLFSVKAAARLLKISWSMIYHVTSAGLIRPASENGRGVTGYSFAELRDFKEKYLFAREIHLSDAASKTRVYAALIRKNILPVLPPGPGRRAVWRAKDIESIKGARILRDELSLKDGESVA